MSPADMQPVPWGQPPAPCPLGRCQHTQNRHLGQRHPLHPSGTAGAEGTAPAIASWTQGPLESTQSHKRTLRKSIKWINPGAKLSQELPSCSTPALGQPVARPALCWLPGGSPGHISSPGTLTMSHRGAGHRVAAPQPAAVRAVRSCLELSAASPGSRTQLGGGIQEASMTLLPRDHQKVPTRGSSCASSSGAT